MILLEYHQVKRLLFLGGGGDFHLDDITGITFFSLVIMRLYFFLFISLPSGLCGGI